MNKISKEEARNFLISYHNLDSSQGFSGEKGVLQYLKRVGCIQFDPLNVVGRNADLVLQSKIKGYTPDILEKLLYEKRSLIDGWDKMMSIYQQEDWPFFSRIRKEKKIEVKNTLSRRDSLEALDLIDKIRDVINNNGPLQANKINIGSSKIGRWGHKKLSSAALDYMFNVGELGIYNKRNTQKVYDLVDNLFLPEIINHSDPFQNDYDFYKWYVKRRVGSVGLIWGRNGGGWLGHYVSNTTLRQSILQELVEAGELISLQVEDIMEIFYIRAEDTQFLNVNISRNEARFLAPLDNFLWDRGMIERLFNFKYSWEVYIPVNKRKYGYYVLPVLYNNQFVARFEPEVHRNNAPLRIKKWWWEEGINVTEEMEVAIKKAVELFCEYLEADGVDKSTFKILGI